MQLGARSVPIETPPAQPNRDSSLLTMTLYTMCAVACISHVSPSSRLNGAAIEGYHWTPWLRSYACLDQQLTTSAPRECCHWQTADDAIELTRIVATIGPRNQCSPAGHSCYVGRDDLSDAQLWEEAKAGDGQAFGDLFDRHSKRIYNHCFRRTADWSMAEDLTSVVFFEAWRRRKDVRPHDGSLLPWLLGVANNCIRNAARARRRYSRLLAKLPNPEDALPLDAEASARVDAESTMTHILEILTQLSPEDQDVLALCDWTDLSYNEAATALSLPVGTVKSRLSRAHGRLRALLTMADMPQEHSRAKGDRDP